jgi:Domain of unknown function (DUF4136)
MKGLVTVLAGCGFLCLGMQGTAAVKVRTQFTQSFDFTKAKTWSWHAGGPGEVKMARTADDDPEVVRKRAEPVILDAVAAELPQRGLAASPSGAPSDLEIKYYVLITVGTESQQIGQFLPAVAAWGLPPFTGATQSYKVIEQGSLVLDISANKEVVWRGIGQAQLKPGQPTEKRAVLLREAVRDILKEYPPKKKK